MGPVGGDSGPGRGRLAEDRALDLLKGEGLKLVERNYRCRFGEIDLIMQDGQTLVFVEVRYRSSGRYGSAQESVTRQKQSRLLTTAACYLKGHRYNGPTRFDVAALSPGANGLAMDWIKGAFQAG